MQQPKIFISYSWSPESNKQKVLQLAERLSLDGVHVVIDEWDLKAGQDKYAFMEQMVNDSTVEKVLLICNKKYAEKANERQGGVGVEGTIISKQVYEDAKQTKFLPVVFEYNEKGEPCIPTFVASAIYIDLSNDDVFENGYDELLRDLFNKPKSKRPPIGKMPVYLEDEEPIYLPTANKVRTIRSAVINRNTNTNLLIRDYLNSFIDYLISYKLDSTTLNQDNFIDEVEKSINEMLPLKEDFLEFVRAIVNTDYSTGELFVDFFEKMLQTYEDNDISLSTSNSISYVANDNYRYFNQDLFLSFCTILFKNECYDVLAEIVKANLLVTESKYSGDIKPMRFTSFRKFNYTLNEYKNKEQGFNKYSLVGFTLKQNNNFPHIDDILVTDLLLYYLSLIYPVKNSGETSWLPETSIYYRFKKVLPKMISKRYFDKIKILFGVNTADEFKNKISSVEEPENSYARWHFNIPDIKTALCFNEVATVD